jgi:hypothetical protein
MISTILKISFHIEQNAKQDDVSIDHLESFVRGSGDFKFLGTKIQS